MLFSMEGIIIPVVFGSIGIMLVGLIIILALRQLMLEE
jgi:hypothetical protein